MNLYASPKMKLNSVTAVTEIWEIAKSRGGDPMIPLFFQKGERTTPRDSSLVVLHKNNPDPLDNYQEDKGSGTPQRVIGMCGKNIKPCVQRMGHASESIKGMAKSFLSGLRNEGIVITARKCIKEVLSWKF